MVWNLHKVEKDTFYTNYVHFNSFKIGQNKVCREHEQYVEKLLKDLPGD